MGRQSRNRALNRVNRDKGLLPVAKQALDSKRKIVENRLSALSWNGYLKYGKGFIFCVNKEISYLAESEAMATLSDIDSVKLQDLTKIFDDYDPNTQFLLFDPSGTKKDIFNQNVLFLRIRPQIAPPEAYRLDKEDFNV